MLSSQDATRTQEERAKRTDNQGGQRMTREEESYLGSRVVPTLEAHDCGRSRHGDTTYNQESSRSTKTNRLDAAAEANDRRCGARFSDVLEALETLPVSIWMVPYLHCASSNLRVFAGPLLLDGLRFH